MSHAPQLDEFRDVFAALPQTAALILAPDPSSFVILAATDEYLSLTHTGPELVGRPLFEALTDNPDNQGATGVDNLRRSLETVLESRSRHRMRIQRYDVQRPDGRWEPRWWAPINAPVLEPDGRVRLIVHDVRDVTDDVLAQQALDQSERRMARTLERMSDAHAVLDRDGVCLQVNPAAERAIGRPARELVGRPGEGLFTGAAEAFGPVRRQVAADSVERHLTHRLAREGGDVHLEIDAYPTDEGGLALFWRDVTERVRVADALQEAAARKDEFLATLAHELRNPLAPLRHGLQILRLAPGTPAAGRAVGLMERQLAHMVRLIDDLMDLSRISRGKVELRLETTDLREVVHDAVEVGRPALEAAGQRLVLRLPDHALPVRVDRTRIVQVLGNLLNNAAKYAQGPGRVDLQVTMSAGDAVMRLSDAGVGIAAADLPRIFDLFIQLHPAGSAAQGGLGIGLSLVKRLVEMHGGDVDAQSGGPGQGATFRVRLPLAADMPAAGDAPADPVRDTSAGNPRRVLVVDDNPDVAAALGTMLQLAGHEVHTAHRGAEALACARRVHPDLAFCDIGMPGMDGYELAARMRADPDLAATRLVAVSGWSTALDRRRSQAAGFDLHLAKPVDADTILAVAQEC